ncbi:hypothetical protein [Kribbella sp. NPDC055071]
MMQVQLQVDLEGDMLGDSRLELLRDRLGLRKRGRLSDDWDVIFGHRDLRPGSAERLWLDLTRDADTSWSLLVSYESEPLSAAELQDLRQQIISTASELGLRIVNDHPAETRSPDRPAARERLAAWMTEKSPITGRHFSADDLAEYTVTTRDDWLIFTPPARTNRVYLVSDDTIYSYAPSRETLETAIANAQAQRDEPRQESAMRLLNIYLQGEVDGTALRILRERLDLTPRGRIDDGWDQEFGERALRAPEQGRAELNLFRHADDYWSLQVSADAGLIPHAEVEQLRRQMLAVVEAAGLTVSEQIPLPGEQQIAPNRLGAARRRLTAWLTDNSEEPGRTSTTADLDHYAIEQQDDWLVFSPRNGAGPVYLVGDNTVFAFSPASETLEAAIANAQAERD